LKAIEVFSENAKVELKTWLWVYAWTPGLIISTGRKIERLIKKHCPEDLRSKSKSIEPWIGVHYNVME
jgi:hypothetical protein